MDRRQIRDEQVIERYLGGTLTAAEEQAFEEAYLADPQLLEELELAERLRAGLKEAGGGVAGSAGVGGSAGATAYRAGRRARWQALVASPRYGLAASLVAAVALASTAALLVQNRTLRTGAPAAGQTHTRLLQLVSVRGADNPNQIAAPAPGEWTVLLLDPGFGDYDTYRAVLARDGAEVLRLDGLTPTYEDQLALGMPGDLLAPGDYEIRLSGRKRDWPADRESDEVGRTPLTVAARP
ncbi:MAG TPA: hypothetical protein VFO94_07820 [Gammaproteobacteria bacterium]|nr:hypothetical protein [Gammaproteobacteria bacterium]